MKKIIGYNFLHSHPKVEDRLGVDNAHVIVDKDDWEIVVKYFNNNPNRMAELNGENVMQYFNTEKTISKNT